MERRQEIDGLRALAVIPIIFFHAGFDFFDGGFVGVDVFFVISGYLITRIILTELKNESFSLTNFYERRIRRILPALYLVVIVSIPLAWLSLEPNSMRDFSQSLVAISIFSTNILFWAERGYFDTAAEFKPLLHTWSLAVEEQFYLFFPVFLLVVWRFLKRRLLDSLIIICVFSFTLAELLVHSDSVAAFYLFPTRAWELLFGAIAFIYRQRIETKRFSVLLSEVAGWIGLLMILSSVLAFSRTTPVPSVYTLAPTLGSVLFILFASSETLVGRLLSRRFLVAIGLISYSLYLWHQPLFAFLRHISLGEPDSKLFIIAIFVSTLLAWLSWRIVETPFRKPDFLGKKTVYAFAAGGALLISLFGLLGEIRNGFPVDAVVSQEKISSDNFIVIGDSHGGHLVSGLASATSGTVSNKTNMGCIPFRDVDRYDSRFRPGDCAKQINKYLDEVISQDPNAVVVLSSMGPVYLDGVPFNGKDFARTRGQIVELITNKSIKDPYKVYEIGLRKTLSELTQLKKCDYGLCF